MATPAATVMIDRIVLTPTEEVQLQEPQRSSNAPTREEQREQGHGIREFHGGRGGDQPPGHQRPRRSRTPTDPDEGGQDQGDRQDVDMGTQHTDGEDQRIERPQHVHPAGVLLVDEPAQTPPHQQPRGDNHDLPGEHDEPQVRATDGRRTRLDQGRERAVDTRFGPPRLLDRRRDRVAAAGEVRRRGRPRVPTEPEDPAVGRVVDVISGPDRCRQDGKQAQSAQNPWGPPTERRDRSPQGEGNGDGGHGIRDPEQSGDERRREGEGQQAVERPTGAQVRFGRIRA